VLAGHEEDLLGLCAFQHLIERVIFPRLGGVAEISSVNDEVRLLRQAVNLIDGRLERTGDVGIRRLVETHVAIANLDEVELPFCRGHLLAEGLRCQDAAANCPNDSSSGPGHTLQEAAPVNAVFIVIVNDYFRQVSPHVDLFELLYGVPYSDQPVFIPVTIQKFRANCLMPGISMCARQYP
jgi:hypothetical protein